jgi:hypothetical protein
VTTDVVVSRELKSLQDELLATQRLAAPSAATVPPSSPAELVERLPMTTNYGIICAS